MTLNPLPKNYEMEYLLGNLTFTTPVRRKVSGGLVFLAVMWLAAITWFIWFLFFSEEKATWDITALGITLFFMAIFLFRIYPVLKTLVWQALIKESIEVTYPAVKVRRQILGIGWTKEYESEFIDSIRAVQPEIKKFEILRYGLASVEVQVAGPVILSYKNKIIALCFSLDYLEGREVAEAIYKSYPKYNK